jgi:hypothetical protein
MEARSAYEIVKFDGGDALVNARDDLLRNGSSIDMFGIETVAEPWYSGRDLVELHPFLAAICWKERPVSREKRWIATKAMTRLELLIPLLKTNITARVLDERCISEREV